MKLVFAGTKMGRQYVQQLLKCGEKVIVSTATEYGASLYEPHENLIINNKKMNYEEMIAFIQDKNIDEIIDTTHPYAVQVTENMIKCAKNLKIPYRVIERDSFIEKKGINGLILAHSYEEACNLLIEKEGNILLAIGSNNVQAFQKIPKNRIYIRVLPTSKVLEKCETLGFTPKNIIAMQGPFSYEMNRIIIQEHAIKYMVTKDSGTSGGVEEKIQSALDMGVEVVMIPRK